MFHEFPFFVVSLDGGVLYVKVVVEMETLFSIHTYYVPFSRHTTCSRWPIPLEIVRPLSLFLSSISPIYSECVYPPLLSIVASGQSTKCAMIKLRPPSTLLSFFFSLREFPRCTGMMLVIGLIILYEHSLNAMYIYPLSWQRVGVVGKLLCWVVEIWWIESHEKWALENDNIIGFCFYLTYTHFRFQFITVW